MDLDDIKRGLRAEIKKRENEQYFTFQCNVRQMCKDVLAKLEEQEAEIAELEKLIADGDKDFEMANHQNERLLKIVRRHKYKRCLAMAKNCALEVYRLRKIYHMSEIENQQAYLLKKINRRNRWIEYLQQLAEKFKEAK